MNIVEKSSQGWSDITLKALCDEAFVGERGIALREVRGADGLRMILVICVTSAGPISMLEQAIDWSSQDTPGDWASISLRDFVVRCGSHGGLACEDLPDGQGQHQAIAIAAVGQQAVRIVEGLFRLSADKAD